MPMRARDNGAFKILEKEGETVDIANYPKWYRYIINREEFRVCQ